MKPSLRIGGSGVNKAR